MRFASPAALLDAVGADLGETAWEVVTQERVDAFAAATGDHQWIHVDATRAAAGPFGGTIAHGFLTLSLVVPAVFELLVVEEVAAVVNAGTDRVRFLTPVPVGGSVRVRATLSAAESVRTGIRVTLHVEVDLEGSDRPALVGEVLLVVVPA